MTPASSGFRPGEDLAPGELPALEAAAFGFTDAANAGGTDLDVLIGYQLLLGRDPENSFVIADAKSSPVRAFISALISSGEFQSAVLDRLESGRALPHETSTAAPTRTQMDWLFRHISVPDYAETMLRSAPTWRDWMRVLMAVPGIPKPHARTASQAQEPAVAAGEADEGFVLIHLDQPKSGDKLHAGALVSGNGWTIAPADVTEVAVLLDEVVLTHARYGLPRPDVARNFPHYRHVDHCGFSFAAEIPADAPITATTQLTVRVRTARGEEGLKSLRVLPPLEKTVAQKAASTEDAWPIRLSVDEAVVDDARVLRLRGWATARTALKSITIALGETPLGPVRSGLARPDIAQAYPDYANAEKSGFALVHELPTDIPAGPGFVRVHATDKQGITRQTIVPLDVPPPLLAKPLRPDTDPGAPAPNQPDQALPADGTLAPGEAPIEFACDVASLGEDGWLAVSGWAVAASGIAAIEVTLDRELIGTATAGILRPDVARRFAANPEAARSGFALAEQLQTPPEPGLHQLELRFQQRGGGQRVLHLPLSPVPRGKMPPEALDLLSRPGSRPSLAAEPVLQAMRPDQAAAAYASLAGEATPPLQRTAPDMRLEIDFPERQGHAARDILRGALTISGWVVARSGVESVAVLSDGTLLGHAHLGMRREDIGAAFSDYPGSLLGGYAFVLPPGHLAPGNHEIAVLATAKAAGGAEPTSVETRFLLNVAPYAALPPGGDILNRVSPASASLGLAALDRFAFRPVFEIVVGPGGSEDDPALAATLRSLSAQAYPDWTCTVFVPDGVLAKLRAAAGKADPLGRIACAGQTSRQAPTRAAGPKTRQTAAKKTATAKILAPRYLMKLRSGDVLGADALLEMALAAAASRDAGFLYSDELRHDAAQERRQPFFKPDWSPTLLLAMNYIGRLWCATTATVEAAGLTPRALAAASDYEAVLRLTEQAGTIVHLPRVLCARGEHAGEAGDTPAEEKAALTAALARRNIAGKAEAGPVLGLWRIRRRIAKPRPARSAAIAPGLVSIIIPTCSAGGLVRTAIASIRATTAPGRPNGPRAEIVILDNTPATEKRARAWLRKHADTVIDMPGPFNWSRFNNVGAAAARGEYFLFLNDDIEIAQPDWLEALLEYAQLPETGIVGAKLLYPDGKVQHAGQYLADGHARHAFRFADAQNPGPFGLAAAAREMIAVTGACQMMHRRIFKKLGGFEEAHSIVNNDLDFCLRAWAAGLAVIYTPHAVLTHRELASRARLEDTYDEARFTTAWRDRFLLGDPFRNPHLARDSDHYGPEPEPVTSIHAGRRAPRPADVRRILALKLDHLGDFLTALPALRSLRERFPQAEIDLLVPNATAALAAPGGTIGAGVQVDRVMVFDFFHARSAEGRKKMGESDYADLAARLLPNRYDLAIDLRMHPDTRPMLQHTGAAFLAGYDHAGKFPWLDIALEWEGDIRLVRKRAHVSERLVQLVSAVADAGRDFSVPAAAMAPQRRPASAKMPALAGLSARFLARPLACIHPGVGNVVRQWPAASYAALIDMLHAEAGLHSVLIGAAEEAPIADEILRRVARPGIVESLVGRVKLAELPAVMRACVLFVGNNSGPQHIAASLGLPTLGIHSGVVDAAEWAPLGTEAMAIRREMICSPCYLEFASDCPRDLACLKGLLPRDVLAACRKLLGAQLP